MWKVSPCEREDGGGVTVDVVSFVVPGQNRKIRDFGNLVTHRLFVHRVLTTFLLNSCPRRDFPSNDSIFIDII